MKKLIKDQVETKRGEIESAIVKPIFRTSTNYRRFPKKYIILDNTRITESAGYITAQQRIENIINAGHRLEMYRKEQFDFPNGKIDESFNDPTRSPNFDMADASTLALETDSRLSAQKAKAEAEENKIKEEKEKQIAEDQKEFEKWKSKKSEKSEKSD